MTINHFSIFSTLYWDQKVDFTGLNEIGNTGYVQDLPLIVLLRILLISEIFSYHSIENRILFELYLGGFCKKMRPFQNSMTLSELLIKIVVCSI